MGSHKNVRSYILATETLSDTERFPWYELTIAERHHLDLVPLSASAATLALVKFCVGFDIGKALLQTLDLLGPGCDHAGDIGIIILWS